MSCTRTDQASGAGTSAACSDNTDPMPTLDSANPPKTSFEGYVAALLSVSCYAHNSWIAADVQTDRLATVRSPRKSITHASGLGGTHDVSAGSIKPVYAPRPRTSSRLVPQTAALAGAHASCSRAYT
jgi:hypothetical protein